MKQYLSEIFAGFIIAITIIVITMAANLDVPFIYQGF